MSFESAAPPTKNWGSSKICVTRWTSAGERFSLLCSARPYKHLFLSFSKSNSISLQKKNQIRWWLGKLLYRDPNHLLKILPEFPVFRSTISSNTLYFVFTVFNRFFKLLCNKQAALFFSKGNVGHGGCFYSSHNGRRHGEKGEQGLSWPFRDSRGTFLYNGNALWVIVRQLDISGPAAVKTRTGASGGFSESQWMNSKHLILALILLLDS